MNRGAEKLYLGLRWLLAHLGVVELADLPELPRFSYSGKWPIKDVIGFMADVDAEPHYTEHRALLLSDHAGELYDMVLDLMSCVTDKEQPAYRALLDVFAEMRESAAEQRWKEDRAAHAEP